MTPTTRSPVRQTLALLAALLVAYFAFAYLIAPRLWSKFTRAHPGLDEVPGITQTGSGIPADPLNVALIGSKEEVMKIMVAAKWYPANPLTLKSCLEIAEATVLKRPYDEAPVSSEYLFGRKEDLAFEKPVGDNPRERHHVRFWKTDKPSDDGRPMWIGSAIFDRSAGISHTTGQFTHHTGPDIDVERDFLFADLKQTGDLVQTSIEANFHKVLSGKNGEGDRWHTDGSLWVGIINSKVGQ